MRTTILLAMTTLAALISAIDVSANVALGEEGSREMIRANRNRQQQVREIERRLGRLHGENVWYVFQVAGFRPSVTRSAGRVSNGTSSRDYVALGVNSQLETRVYRMHGCRAAAETIWLGNQLPVCFVYRTFRDERDAKAFYETLCR